MHVSTILMLLFRFVRNSTIDEVFFLVLEMEKNHFSYHLHSINAQGSGMEIGHQKSFGSFPSFPPICINEIKNKILWFLQENGRKTHSLVFHFQWPKQPTHTTHTKKKNNQNGSMDRLKIDPFEKSIKVEKLIDLIDAMKVFYTASNAIKPQWMIMALSLIDSVRWGWIHHALTSFVPLCVRTTAVVGCLNCFLVASLKSHFLLNDI